MFESHITVAGVDERLFQAQCRILKVKPILIQRDSGSGIPQMMTGKFHHTQSMRRALDEMFGLGKAFGPNVIRRKLERIAGTSGDVLYRESHLKFSVPPAELDNFRELASEWGGHTSQNKLKLEAGDGRQFEFATFRDKTDAELGLFEIICNDREWKLVGTISEEVVYDDNPSIDRYWTSCMECGLKAAR